MVRSWWFKDSDCSWISALRSALLSELSSVAGVAAMGDSWRVAEYLGVCGFGLRRLGLGFGLRSP